MKERKRTSNKRTILIVAALLIIIITGLAVLRIPYAMGIGTSAWNTFEYNGVSFRLPPDWEEELPLYSLKRDRGWSIPGSDLECFTRCIDAENHSDLYERYKASGTEALVEDEISNFAEPQFITIKVKEKKELEIDGVQCFFLRFTFLEQYPGDEDAYVEYFCLWIPVNDGESITEITLTNNRHNDISRNNVLKGIIRTVGVSEEN